MINHEQRFLFIHIPKSGGTSIQVALRGKGLVLQGEPNFDSIYFKHLTAVDARRMLGEMFDKYFRFTVVRNPWDWVVSNYAFNRGLSRPWIRGSEHSPIGMVPDFAEDWTFAQWLPWWIETFAPSQWQSVCDYDGNLLVDEVIRFEDLDEGFRRVARRLKLRVKLQHTNKTEGRRAHLDYYDPALRDLVADHFARDIDLFGYRVPDLAG